MPAELFYEEKKCRNCIFLFKIPSKRLYISYKPYMIELIKMGTRRNVNLINHKSAKFNCFFRGKWKNYKFVTNPLMNHKIKKYYKPKYGIAAKIGSTSEPRT